MSNAPKETPYIYQPFGSQNTDHWAAKRIYAVATDSMLTKISGLTKDEAERVLKALKPQELAPETPTQIATELGASMHREKYSL